MNDQPVKLCDCGCGLPAPIAKKTRKQWGHIKGQPISIIRGHAMGKYEIDRSIRDNKDRQCRKNYKQRAIERGRAFVREYLLTHPCVDCGASNPIVLEFDHRDPQTKTKGIADLIGLDQASNEKLAIEIAKCDVRCATCHRIRHVMERENGR